MDTADHRGTTSRRPRLTLERLLWTVLILAAIATRFWDLGSRTLHHDESLHTYYSWFFATGEIPYRHDPLMHGPFLFHANALVYWLFGSSDATSRFVPALAGVLIIGAPWFLRGRDFLGRWGALAAAFMLLISPSFLYYTRYIRHDPYTCLGAIVMCIAIFRYLQQPRRVWMLTAFGSLAFMLTNHEIVFAIVLAFVLVLWCWLLAGRLRVLIPVHLLTMALGLGVLVLRRVQGWEPLPDIPWRNPTQADVSAYYAELIRNPLVLSAIGVGLVFVIGCASTLIQAAKLRAEPGQSGLDALLGGSRPGTVAYGVLWALRDPVGLTSGVLLAMFVFFGLFTTLFTNLDGIASSTYATDGTLLYWLGQHDERRGNQPWFYFLTESVQYEWLAIIFAAIGLAIVVARLIRSLSSPEPQPPRVLFGVFVAFWFIFLFAVLSWAGEKMPWLIMHFLLPGILLGGMAIQGLAEALPRLSITTLAPSRLRLTSGGLVAALVLLAGGWFFVAGRLTYGSWGLAGNPEGPRIVTAGALDTWWALALFPMAGLLLVGAFAIVNGALKTVYPTIVATIIVLSLFQVHAGFRLAYVQGDVAIDTLIYNTTGPDVTQLDADLEELSLMTYGDEQLSIGYDSCAAWPLTWYFRDQPQANRIDEADLEAPDTLPDVVIGVPQPWDTTRGCYMPEEIDGYSTQTYVLRWHEPESLVYRDFAIAPELTPRSSAWGSEANPSGPAAIVESMWSSVLTLTEPEGQQRAFRLVFFRELPGGLTTYRYQVYIRDDLMPSYNDVRYGE